MVMAQSRLSPEALLSDWRAFGLPFAQQPCLLSALPGGRTNRSFLIKVGSHRMVLRLNSIVDGPLGIDREREATILDLVTAHDLTAPVVHNDPASGLLITEYIEGKPINRADPRLHQRLLDLLEQVHALAIDLPRFDYLEHEAVLWQAAGFARSDCTSPLIAVRERMRESIARLQEIGSVGSLCHHDPAPENVIDSGERLYLIDWEYAGRGASWFDLAALIVAWRLDACDVRLPITPQHVVTAIEVYNYICELWEIARLVAMCRATQSSDAVLDHAHQSRIK